MGKTIDIPDSFAKTQLVEEIFRNIKDSPEKQQAANASATAQKLARESHDVVNLSQVKPDDREEEDKSSSYRDDGRPDTDEQPEKGAEDQLDDEESSDKQYNQKGKNLDIEG